MKINQSLAVRYRPKKLESIIGQETVLNSLKGMFKKKEINPTYLISGPSGVGKTSLARILASYINCQAFDFDAVVPCRKCDYCLAVANNVYNDVQQLNFSDSRGIDSVRDIIDDMQYESSSNAKIYILDEMHNMTSQAQNAILVPLEEPPANTVFILLTTEPRKVLPAIRNRCIHITLDKIPESILFKYLRAVTKREAKEIPDSALKYITSYVRGDLRLALASLETIFHALDNEGTDVSKQETLLQLLGTNYEDDPYTVADYIFSIYSGRYSSALAVVHKLVKAQSNLKSFFDRVHSFHSVTFNLLVDPNRAYPELFGDYYNDWIKTVEDAIPQGNFFVVVPSALEMLDILVHLTSKLGLFEQDENQLVQLATIKMVEAVRSKAAEAYKGKSALHNKYPKKESTDD